MSQQKNQFEAESRSEKFKAVGVRLSMSIGLGLLFGGMVFCSVVLLSIAVSDARHWVWADALPIGIGLGVLTLAVTAVVIWFWDRAREREARQRAVSWLESAKAFLKELKTGWTLAAEGVYDRAEYPDGKTVIHFDDGRTIVLPDCRDLKFPRGARIKVWRNSASVSRFDPAGWFDITDADTSPKLPSVLATLYGDEADATVDQP